MKAQQTAFKNGWIIVRDGLPVPMGCTGYFDTKAEAEMAIAWYYGQTAIA